jgi:hypothetical protein
MTGWLLEADRLAEALDWAERGRARVLLDQLALARVDLSRDIPTPIRLLLEQGEREARARLAELQARLAFVEQRSDLDEVEQSSQRTRLAEDLNAAARDVQQAASALRRASPLWHDLVTSGGRPAPLSEIRSELLLPDRALLFYVVGEPDSRVIVLSGDGTSTHRELRIDADDATALGVPAGPLREGILEAILRGDADQGLAEALGGSRGLTRVLDREAAPPSGLHRRLQALFRVLVPRDLWPSLKRAREVLVVPDGALHGLPFEALVVALSPEGRPSYWLDEGPVVSYAPSATTACNLARHRDVANGGASSAVVVANPLFERESSAPLRTASRARRRLGTLPPLPGTAREAEEIRRSLLASLSEVVVLSEEGAGEAAVRQALGERPRLFLHFATHGLVEQGRSELLAALALTPSEESNPPAADDGLLQLFEIYELDARSELVVLSACDSNMGRRVTGEGVFALSRAFLAAGARRVVASLWPVDDASTAALMGGFYRRLAAAGSKGVDYSRALRDARREVRERAEWSHPHYWAPFVLTGAR